MANEHLRKAAILLLSLSDEQTAELLAKLTPRQAQMVSAQIARLDRPSGAEQQAIIRELAAANSNTADEIELNAGAGALSFSPLPFIDLQNVKPEDLLQSIRDEHPQTIALVLSHLPPAQAAWIIQSLPLETAITVIRRVASLAPTSPDVIQEVERALASRIAKLPSQSSSKTGGASSVAEILSAVDETTEQALLESLAQADPALVEKIRWQLFAGEDTRKAA
jgi:flagellar motor switch protein FliG